MNRTLGFLLASIPGITGLKANFTPAAWHSTALDVVVTTNNNWYLYPDNTGNPRILAKATTSNNTPGSKILSGGPPAWTSGASVSMGQINKQGVFVPSLGGGGFLVAPHYAAAGTTGPLKVAVFDSSGSFTLETVDTNAGNYTGISAELDSTGRLHVGYIDRGNTVCYARRNATGTWIFTSLTLPAGSVIHDTAVVPITTNDVNLYYTSTASNVTTLWQAKPGFLNSMLYIQWAANPLINVENFVGQTLRGSRIGAVGRLFYFGSNNTSSWTFKLYNNLGTKTDLETAGNVSPKSIHVAFGPDGKQRVAWYNATSKKIHYLKPIASGVDVPTPAGQPIALTGAPSDPDLLGLHFGPDGTPYILYRRDLNEGFVAFPNDNFDFNGNGRAEILDTAFNSNQAGLEVLPVAPAALGVFNSANRFKIRFPTIGSATTNGTGGIQTSTENLLYKVEVSPDMATWTPLNSGTAITYTPTALSGTLKTFVGVISDPAPGAFPARFARLNVTRLNYPY